LLNFIDQFAPPSSYNFAPPPIDPPSPKVPDDKTGDDAYSRRFALGQSQPPPPTDVPPPPPPEPTPAGVISRAPVRYNLPPAPEDIPASEAELEEAIAAEEEEDAPPEDSSEAPRSLRPGQKGFAERQLAKYGWSKGRGLGADESGIINPLRVQIEKRKKKPDSEGGGFADPKGVGKIIGGKRRDTGKEGKFGDMSEVIVLRGMVDGMDLDEEVGDGGLMQEIGEECGEKVSSSSVLFGSFAIGILTADSTDALNGSSSIVAVSLQRFLLNSQVNFLGCGQSMHWKGGYLAATLYQPGFLIRRNLSRARMNNHTYRYKIGQEPKLIELTSAIYSRGF
jgi:hypothetical protein